jgi:hypothetical protein
MGRVSLAHDLLDSVSVGCCERKTGSGWVGARMHTNGSGGCECERKNEAGTRAGGVGRLRATVRKN